MFDYCIFPDGPEGIEIGFTSNLFEGIMWKEGNYIVISDITSKKPRQGNLNQLFKNIINKGLGIKITNPLPIMENICKKKGFILTQGPVHPGICDDVVNIYIQKPNDKLE